MNTYSISFWTRSLWWFPFRKHQYTDVDAKNTAEAKEKLFEKHPYAEIDFIYPVRYDSDRLYRRGR